MHGYRNGYNKTQRWLTNQNGYGNNMANNTFGGNNGGLIYLLYNIYPNLKKQYQKISIGYNSQVITNEFTVLDDLKSRIDDETNNAQGQNP